MTGLPLPPGTFPDGEQHDAAWKKWGGICTQNSVARPWALAYSQRFFGAVAQLGERVVRNDEVRGSIPLGSTKFPLFAD